MASFMSSMEANTRQAAREREKIVKGMKSLARQNQKLMEEVITLHGLVDSLVRNTTNRRQTVISTAEMNTPSTATLPELIGLPEEFIVSKDYVRDAPSISFVRKFFPMIPSNTTNLVVPQKLILPQTCTFGGCLGLGITM